MVWHCCRCISSECKRDYGPKAMNPPLQKNPISAIKRTPSSLTRLGFLSCCFNLGSYWPGGGVSGDGVPHGWPIWTENKSAPRADTMRCASTVRSGDLMGFGVTVTPLISGDLGRHLLGEFRELPGLRGYRLELPACMRGRQLYEL